MDRLGVWAVDHVVKCEVQGLATTLSAPSEKFVTISQTADGEFYIRFFHISPTRTCVLEDVIVEGNCHVSVVYVKF